MKEGDTIRFIVGTYDLPPQTKETVARIAEERLNGRGVVAFDQQYSYIAELVDRFTQPYTERRAASLDERISREDDRTVHEVVGREDCNLRELVRGKHQVKTLHSYEVIDILQDHLENNHLEFIGGLLRSNAELLLWGSSSAHLLRNIGHVKTAMRQLELDYGRKGRIVLPPRPIRAVKNENGQLQIEFGKRRYTGDPLTFFQENWEYYGGMSRTELARVDQGLYMSLRNAGQLELAIPTRYERRIDPARR